jgi:hypothetical protein
MPRRFAPLHVGLALPCRPMGMLTPMIAIATLAMFDPRPYLTLGRAGAFQLVRDNDPRHGGQPLKELTEALLGRLRVAPPLAEDVQDIVVLLHRPPQGMALTMHGEKHCIQGPCIPGLRPPSTQPIGVVLPKRPTPLAHGFVRHSDTAFAQELFHVAVAQGEPIVEPDPMAENFAGKTVFFQPLFPGRI